MYIKNIYLAPPVAYERQACLGIYTTHVKIQHGYYAAKYQNSGDLLWPNGASYWKTVRRSKQELAYAAVSSKKTLT